MMSWPGSRARPAPSRPATSAHGHDRRNGTVPANGGVARGHGDHGRPQKPATASQVKAIYAIARRQHANLEGLLDGYGVARPEDLR